MGTNGRGQQQSASLPSHAGAIISSDHPLLIAKFLLSPALPFSWGLEMIHFHL